MLLFFFSSRRRHTRCALVTGVQTCALPICIGEIVDVRGTRRRGVKHAGAWQMVLEENAANALLRAFLRPESALAARDTAHFVSFVKADHAFEIIARPIDDLLQSAVIAARRAKRRIGDDQHALLDRY